jgi:hypothetical protein
LIFEQPIFAPAGASRKVSVGEESRRGGRGFVMAAGGEGVYLKATELPQLRQFPVDLPPLIMTSRDILGRLESITGF